MSIRTTSLALAAIAALAIAAPPPATAQDGIYVPLLS